MSSVHCGGPIRRPPTQRWNWHRVAAFYLALILATNGALAADLVAYSGPGAPGTIRVETGARLLYLVLGHNRAWRYRVGVGRAGRQWAGQSKIAGRYLAPDWEPPPEIRQDNPLLPARIEGGSPANPIGAAALVLTGGRYAIHGTNAPASIGGFVSYGCIRMLNADILDLMARVHIGTRVEVVP